MGAPLLGMLAGIWCLWIVWEIGMEKLLPVPFYRPSDVFSMKVWLYSWVMEFLGTGLSW